MMKMWLVSSDYLAKREVKIQEHENKIRERRDARLAAEREHRNKGMFVKLINIVFSSVYLNYSLYFSLNVYKQALTILT